MRRPDLVVRGRTFDHGSFRPLLGMVRTLTTAGEPWTACAEEHRSGTMAIRLSTGITRDMTLDILEEGCSVATVEIPWNIDAGREIADAAAAVRSVAEHMELFATPCDDISIVDAWIIGVAGIMKDEGHDPIMVHLRGPSMPLSVMDASDMQPIRSATIDRLNSACPMTLQAEGNHDGGTLWIHPSGGLTGRGESHCLIEDPIATLRAIAFVRARLDATR